MIAKTVKTPPNRVKMPLVKEFFELGYWKMVKWLNGSLTNDHYRYFYTEYFGVPESYYRGKVILDVGCGPRGSLEWADMAAIRIGVDPLADAYLKLGNASHQMEYVKAYVEELPFPADHFDLVSSFNSLDHVKDLARACAEMTRVLKPGGLLLLIVDIHSYPTLTEPQMLHWDLLNDHFREMEICQEKKLETVNRHRIYTNLRQGRLKREGDFTDGVLTAKMRKKRFDEK